MVAVKPPASAVPAALYVEAQTYIQGVTTDITGLDRCGSDNKPGVLTTLPPTVLPAGLPAVWQLESPMIMGNPDIVYNGTNLIFRRWLIRSSTFANLSYTVKIIRHAARPLQAPAMVKACPHWDLHPRTQRRVMSKTMSSIMILAAIL